MKDRLPSSGYRGTQCLNCEHSLDISDKYCPACGQLNSTKKLSFDDFFNEFFAGVFAYDSRLRRTLNALLFHPGKISGDYIRGKRMRYANPFRFYLSASIIFFIVWGFSGSFDDMNLGGPSGPNQDLSEEERAKLKEELKDIPSTGIINVDSLVTNQQAQPKTSYKEAYISQAALDSLPLLTAFSKQFLLYEKFYGETEITRPEIALDSLQHLPTTYNSWTYQKAIDLNKAMEEPRIFLDYFIGKLPFIIFFYLPVFALFVWLLYLRKPYNYMEHLIFTFHVQTTFFVLLILGFTVDLIFDTNYGTIIILLLFLLYLYKALRKFYEQGRFKTIVKFSLLNGIFFILAVFTTIFALIASFVIY